VDSSNGTIAAHYKYAPFGGLLVADGPEAEKNPYRFSTKYLNVETGLYHYGYRDYSLELARWTSRDPLEEEGGLNLYAFVDNDPINFIDILGLILVTWKGDGYAYICGKKDAGVTDFVSMDTPTKANIAERFGLTVKELNAFAQNSSLSRVGEHEELPADSKVWVVLTPTGDAQLLARLAYSEGTSGNADDKYAVASVVINRIAHKKKYPRVSPYESTIQSVIYQKTPGGANEFEALTISKWSNSANPIRLTIIDEIMDWNLSAKGAEKAMKVGPMSDLKGATVFHSTSKYGEKKKIIPGQVAVKYWNIQYITQFGEHYYFVVTPKSKP
jgi:RHS repeat-associated protein